MFEVKVCHPDGATTGHVYDSNGINVGSRVIDICDLDEQEASSSCLWAGRIMFDDFRTWVKQPLARVEFPVDFDIGFSVVRCDGEEKMEACKHLATRWRMGNMDLRDYETL